MSHNYQGNEQGDWQFTKRNDTWCRRPINTTEPWQALTTTLVGRPSDSGHRKGPDNKQLPSIMKWTWK